MRATLTSPTYRPDIDGLRAIAVLSVIGFHASPDWFPGGYVGVDIFFVISGFLITSIIGRQLQQGNFSFLDFYARRSKRIFPALIIVLAAVFAYGWLFLLPDEFERLGKHIAAGAGFVSNFVFWGESGYFDKAAETKPLLHLWSLGIEEQFYLMWPPLLVWAWRRKWDGLNVSIAIVTVSFALNVILVSLWQLSGTYYLPPARVWELLLGSGLAWAHLFRRDELNQLKTRLCGAVARALPVSPENLQATSGLLLIVVAVAALDKTTLFPGWWALLPTLGALLLISAGPTAWINRRLLSSGLFVFVGLISYPLYLWHWPVLSYAQIMTSAAPSAGVRLGAVATAILLAWLTYRIIEKPIRFQPHPVALGLATALTAVGVLGIAAFSGRWSARSERYAVEAIVKASTSDWEYPGPGLKVMHTDYGYHFERGGGSHKALFVGDSHMEQYYARIDRILTEQADTARGVVFVTRRSCLPIHHIDGFTRSNCDGLLEQAFSLAQRPDVDTIVIGAAWNRYDVFQSSERDRALQDLSATINDYRRIGRRVYLILPVPRGEAFDPSVLVKRSLLDFGFVIQEQVERAQVDANVAPIAARLESIAHATGATVLDPVPVVCKERYCPTLADDGMPVYTDNNHLRPAYVREHMTFLDAILTTNQ